MFGTVTTRTIYLYSLLIGVLGGLGALAFDAALRWTTRVTMTVWAQNPIPEPAGEAGAAHAVDGEPLRMLLVLLPVLGGLASGVLVRLFAPEAGGTGTDGYIDAFHNQAGVMRARVPFVKAVATIATLSTGGSAGKEGPTAQIGAGIGSALGRFVRMGARARRTLMVAGAAAGLGAIFRAPLGGALTAIEVLYKEDLETDALTPAVLASVTAYTVFCSVRGFEPVFAFASEGFRDPMQLLVYTALGLTCSAIGILYVLFLRGMRTSVFDRLPVPRILVPAIGGLLVGVCGYVFPQVLGSGLGYVQQLLRGEPVGGLAPTVGFLAALALLKIFTTSCTISSGGSGGVFAPSLFIGAMVGGSVGLLAQQWFPALVPDVAPFVVVGMGAFFAGVANAPIASLMMVSELTGAYVLLPPLMLVATLSLITTRKWSIYTSQVQNRFSSPAHLWEMQPAVLRGMTIARLAGDRYDTSAIVPDDTPLPEMERLSREVGETDLVVHDGHGRLVGLVSMTDLDLRGALRDSEEPSLARDLVNRRTVSLTPEDDLIQALGFVADRNFDKVPVVRREPSGDVLLGHVSRRQIVDFYRRLNLQGHAGEGSTPVDSNIG
jgi:CIC family chloride channel protein